MNPAGTPPAEVEITLEVVRALLEAQHPDLADDTLEFVDSGWDNVTYRLGSGRAVRLPRREVGARLLGHEQTWLPRLAPRLPLRVPTPERHGTPQPGFPYGWSVLPWLEGEPADRSPARPDQLSVLVTFLRALHLPAPPDAPFNPARAVPLAQRAELVEARLHDVSACAATWSAWRNALQAPPATRFTWIHGDLHPGNVLVKDGELHAVIDWGDLTCGDPAVDLAAFWMLFPGVHLQARPYWEDPHLWLRARGWAVAFGAMLLHAGQVDHPRHARSGRQILDAVVAEDFGPGNTAQTVR